jgi:hypothetical protein
MAPKSRFVKAKKVVSKPTPSQASKPTPSQVPSSSNLPPSSSNPNPAPLPTFVNSSAQDFYHNFYSKKNIIRGRRVVFNDFADHRIEFLLDKFKLVDLLSLHLPSYPKLMQYFFANLHIEGKFLCSRVHGIDIKMSVKDFADFIGIPATGLKILPDSLRSFDFPEGHSIESLSECLHGTPVQDMYNEDIHLYTLPAQILAKIIFHNLVPKTGEFDRARGCVPILIYCFLQGIPVNIPRLILDQIIASNLATSPKGLPFGMLFTRLFTHWGIPFAGQESLKPPSPLGYSFLQKKRSHRPSITVEDAPQDAPPVMPSSSSSARAYTSDSFSSFVSQYNIDLSRMAASARYQQATLNNLCQFHQIELPSVTAECNPLPYQGPPFLPWSPPSSVPAGFADDDDMEDAGDGQ